MTDSAGWRRLQPPPRRRPGLLEILVRWRIELVLGMALGLFWYHAGTVVTEIVAGLLVVPLVALPGGRSAAVAGFQLVAVPHRVRSAFVQAGVASREGRLPRIFWARLVGPAVVIRVGLRPGVVVDDLRDATPVLEAACGAAQVDVVADPSRADRVTIVVVRPRRGAV